MKIKAKENLAGVTKGKTYTATRNPEYNGMYTIENDYGDYVNIIVGKHWMVVEE